jgi:hypothetical protein
MGREEGAAADPASSGGLSAIERLSKVESADFVEDHKGGSGLAEDRAVSPSSTIKVERPRARFGGADPAEEASTMIRAELAGT